MCGVPSTVWHLKQPLLGGERCGPARPGSCAASTRSAERVLGRPASVERRALAPATRRTRPAACTTTSAQHRRVAQRRSTRRSRPGTVPGLRGLEPGLRCSGRAARPASRGTPGTKKEWMTSREVMSSRTGRSAGTRSTSTPFGPPGIGELPHPLLALHVDVHRVRAAASCSRTKSRKPMANQSRKNASGTPTKSDLVPARWARRAASSGARSGGGSGRRRRCAVSRRRRRAEHRDR